MKTLTVCRLFAVLYFGLTCDLWASGFEVLDGELATVIDVTSCFECTGTEGAGTETVPVLPEVTSYSISRIGTATYPGGFEAWAASADLGFDYSPAGIAIDGVARGSASGNIGDVEGSASLAGNVSFELAEAELVQVVYPLGVNRGSGVHLTTLDGASVFDCFFLEVSDVVGGCEFPDISEPFPYEDPFLLDAGRHNLSFNVSTIREVGNETPGVLNFAFVVVPEPSSFVLLLAAMVVYSNSARRVFTE